LFLALLPETFGVTRCEQFSDPFFQSVHVGSRFFDEGHPVLMRLFGQGILETMKHDRDVWVFGSKPMKQGDVSLIREFRVQDNEVDRISTEAYATQNVRRASCGFDLVAFLGHLTLQKFSHIVIAVTDQDPELSPDRPLGSRSAALFTDLAHGLTLENQNPYLQLA